MISYKTKFRELYLAFAVDIYYGHPFGVVYMIFGPKCSIFVHLYNSVYILKRCVYEVNSENGHLLNIFQDEDEANMDSFENIVDNDAAELELLKEKARQQAAAEAKNIPASAENTEDEAEQLASSWASSRKYNSG